MEGSPKAPKGHEFCWRGSYTFYSSSSFPAFSVGRMGTVMAFCETGRDSAGERELGEVSGTLLCLWPVVGPGAVSDPVKFSLIGLQGSSLINSVV